MLNIKLNPNQAAISRLKLFLLLLCAAPAMWLTYLAFDGGLGANPIEKLIRECGDWALRFLLITLSITPLRQILGWAWLLRFRRMLGVTSFMYAFIHLSIWLVFDQSLDILLIFEEIIKRPFITIGMITILMMLPLAITSNNKSIKKLGGKTWQKLHRLVYPLSMTAVLHYFMMVKRDITEPLIYIAILALLLGWRLYKKQQSAIAS